MPDNGWDRLARTIIDASAATTAHMLRTGRHRPAVGPGHSVPPHMAPPAATGTSDRERIGELEAAIEAIELTPGPEGPQGPAGPTGPTGPSGSGGGLTHSLLTTGDGWAEDPQLIFADGDVIWIEV